MEDKIGGKKKKTCKALNGKLLGKRWKKDLLIGKFEVKNSNLECFPSFPFEVTSNNLRVQWATLQFCWRWVKNTEGTCRHGGRDTCTHGRNQRAAELLGLPAVVGCCQREQGGEKSALQLSIQMEIRWWEPIRRPQTGALVCHAHEHTLVNACMHSKAFADANSFFFFQKISHSQISFCIFWKTVAPDIYQSK